MANDNSVPTKLHVQQLSFNSELELQTSSLFPDLPPYKPPASGIVSRLPRATVPYAELMRLHKPAGYYAFYLPHLFGTLYAATQISPSLTQLVRINSLLIVGSLFLRGAACTWNDILDAPYDRLVARCCYRPVARGAVSPLAATVFVLLQAIPGGLTLYQLPSICYLPAALLVVTIGIYPFAKRVTHYPQVVLGFSLALGQFVGAAALGIDPLRHTKGETLAGMGCLYLSNVVNAVIYDAIYAHQDLKDDLKASVKSVAVAWQDQTKRILCFLSMVEVGLLGAAGCLFGLGLLYIVVSVAGTATVLGSMLWAVRLDASEDCWRWFKLTIFLTGGTISGGLFAEYLTRLQYQSLLG